MPMLIRVPRAFPESIWVAILGGENTNDFFVFAGHLKPLRFFTPGTADSVEDSAQDVPKGCFLSWQCGA